jgi:hypothetical protein
MTGLQSFQVPVPIRFQLDEYYNGSFVTQWFNTVGEYTFGGGPSGLVGNFTAYKDSFGSTKFEATFELMGHPMPVKWTVTLEEIDTLTNTSLGTTEQEILLTEGTSPVTVTFEASGTDRSLSAISETWEMPA